MPKGLDKWGHWGHISGARPESPRFRHPRCPQPLPRTMALSDTALRAAKPRAKPYRLFDGNGSGLYAEVSPAGSVLWRIKYRIDGREKRLALGSYPATSLADARKRALEARGGLEAGVDPSEARKTATAARLAARVNTFEAVAREWLKKEAGKWAPSHLAKVTARLERDVFPWLGARPVAAITPPEALATLRRIEARGVLETAHLAGQHMGRIFRYAIATGRAERDPMPDLRGALPAFKRGHFAAVTDPARLGELLRAFDSFKGTHQVGAALRLMPLVFVRPGELRKARWADIDLDRAEWKYVASKTMTDHLVPLAPQAVAILQDLKPLTGGGEYVFPGRDPLRPMSDAAINAALRRLGIDTQAEQTGHGFRATARTLLAEELEQDPAAIEHQLAHAVPDALGKAYNRTKFVKQRRAMMDKWAAYLDRLKTGAVVVSLEAHRG